MGRDSIVSCLVITGQTAGYKVGLWAYQVFTVSLSSPKNASKFLGSISKYGIPDEVGCALLGLSCQCQPLRIPPAPPCSPSVTWFFMGHAKGGDPTLVTNGFTVFDLHHN